MKGYFVCVYGAGGSMLDPLGGMATIAQKCAAMGLNGRTTPYDYTDTSMVDWIKGLPVGVPLFLIGDSCGANRLPWIAEAVGTSRNVSGIYPIQASVYCNAGCPDIPTNVENAIVIFSDWAHTGGLGVYIAKPADGNKRTKYFQKYIPAAHPDDQDPAVHKIIFDSINNILNQYAGES